MDNILMGFKKSIAMLRKINLAKAVFPLLVTKNPKCHAKKNPTSFYNTLIHHTSI
jgi:hypothetical protein